MNMAVGHIKREGCLMESDNSSKKIPIISFLQEHHSWLYPIIRFIVKVIIVGGIGGIVYVGITLTNINNSITNLQNDMKTLREISEESFVTKDQLSEVSQRLAKSEESFVTKDQLSEVSQRLAKLEGNVEMLIKNSNTQETPDDNNLEVEIRLLGAVVLLSDNDNVISTDCSKVDDFENNSASASIMQVQDPLACQYDAQERYTEIRLADLENKKVVFHYIKEKENEDVFFYGQFDREGYYEGNCITNIYKNGNLAFITSADYSQGKVQHFVKVFPTQTKQGVDVWAVMDCFVEQDRYNGETRYYINNSPYLQSFESNNVTEDDIISDKDFLTEYDAKLVAYYSGNISNGLFNDGTGNSYYVKYFDNGTVETLYMGKFQDGDFEDATGNAWMICKNDINQENYSYYKGPFINGKRSEDSKYWKQIVDQDWIDKYLQDKTFDCDLVWSLPDQ